jgi:hypothetical protein
MCKTWTHTMPGKENPITPGIYWSMDYFVHCTVLHFSILFILLESVNVRFDI